MQMTYEHVYDSWMQSHATRPLRIENESTALIWMGNSRTRRTLTNHTQNEWKHANPYNINQLHANNESFCLIRDYIISPRIVHIYDNIYFGECIKNMISSYDFFHIKHVEGWNDQRRKGEKVTSIYEVRCFFKCWKLSNGELNLPSTGKYTESLCETWYFMWKRCKRAIPYTDFEF